MPEQTAHSGLDKLRAKYGGQNVQPISEIYDQKSAVRLQDRLGATPGAKTQVGNYQAELGTIKIELAQLAQRYGKLNIQFKELLTGKTKMRFLDLVKYPFANADKNLNIHIEPLGRRVDALESLVDRMGEVLEDQHQRAIKGRDKAKTLQQTVIAHIKYLDKKLIESLKGGNYTTTDLTEAQQEARKIEQELAEVNEVLDDYQIKIKTAQETGKIEDVRKLSEEVGQVLDMKYNILDGRLSTDGIVSDIRRSILDSAEAAASAKAAAAASQVNYQATNALVDAFNELEIKYRHAKTDFLPVFKHQAMITDAGEAALKMRDALAETARISERLMAANVQMIEDVASKTFDLLKMPLYDPERAKTLETEIREYMENLNAQKMAWAEATKNKAMLTPEAHHVRPE